MLLYLFPIMTDDGQSLLEKITNEIRPLFSLHEYSHGYDWMHNCGIDLQPYSIGPQDWLHLLDIEYWDIKQISIECIAYIIKFVSHSHYYFIQLVSLVSYSWSNHYYTKFVMNYISIRHRSYLFTTCLKYHKTYFKCN